MKKTLTNAPLLTGKRMVLYARVSTQEQTKKDYPSCESQIEELEAHCRSRGWDVIEAIRDEGHSAGSLKRPGLTRTRFLVESGQVDGVLCTWYDRLTRSREFYVLDKEFRTHNVDFITLHDPADRNTASGRFMEMMLVGAKAYEREQTGEKVSIKMRMRAEKGMWNGGQVPFGFVRGADHVLSPDPEKLELLVQIFKVYVKSASDFAVRDWLKAHQISAPGGASVWAVGTLRDLLLNRRYIAEIEINKKRASKDCIKTAPIASSKPRISHSSPLDCSSWRRQLARKKRWRLLIELVGRDLTVRTSATASSRFRAVFFVLSAAIR